MKINIETIPHSQQRYPTVGDYWVDPDGTLQIRISDLGNAIYEQAVALHELTEMFLVLNRGISIGDIDAFDIEFERKRIGPEDIDEPGDDPKAPYQNEHCYATAVERMFIAANGVKWADYDVACLDA
jgi:hypothetical protein